MSQDQAEEGGTKIKKRVQIQEPPPVIEQECLNESPPMYINPQQQRYSMNNQMPPPMQRVIHNKHQSNNSEKYSTYEEPEIPPLRILSGDESKLKQTILVIVIFVLLNSKLVWSQLLKLPFMGTVEPSIIALIVNSILAGLAFYILTNLVK